MSPDEIGQLSRLVREADPANIQSLTDILFRMREARNAIAGSPRSDLGVCMDAALTLTQFLPEIEGKVSAEIQDIVGRLVQIVSESTAASGASSAPSGPQAAPVPQPPAPLPTRQAPQIQHPQLPEVPQEPPPAVQRQEDLGLLQDILLGEIMKDMGLIQPHDIAAALRTQSQTGLRFGECLVANGAALPDQVEAALDRQAEMIEAGAHRTPAPAPRPEAQTAPQPAPAQPQAESEARAPLPRRSMDTPEVQQARETQRGSRTIKMTGPPQELRLSGEPSVGPRAALPKRPGAGVSRAQLDELGIMNDMLLGEVLLRLGYISRAQLQQGLRLQRASGTRIGEALVETGAVNWDQIREGVRVQELHRDSPRGFKKQIEL